MRRLIIFVFAIGISISGLFAEAQYSAFTRNFIAHWQRAPRVLTKSGVQRDLPADVRSRFLVFGSERGDRVHGIIEVDKAAVQPAELEQLGIAVNSRIGRLWTVQIPVDSLEALGDAAGIVSISIDSPVRMKLDEARNETKVNLVNAGIDLPQGYNGEGVVVGVIDGGFDMMHPTFSDEAGRLRISRVWNQSAGGAPPAGYAYGTEYSTPDAIALLAATGHGSHGSHVGGIAGGSGRNTPAGQFKGVADRVELVFVELGGGQSAVTDAAKYIFDYAASVGKPAVINMSLGTHIGPHDGTSVQDQAFNALVGPGKVLVGAAGNEGGTPLHVSYAFGAAEETVATIVQFEGPQLQRGTGLLDLWGTPNSTFSVALKVLDAAGTVLAESAGFPSNSSSTTAGALPVGSDSVKYEITAVASSTTNQRPNILIAIENATPYNVALYVTGSNTTVHAWNHGQGGGAALSSLPVGTPFLAGNTDYTTGEIGGTASGLITVGAYTSKNSYTNSAGQTVTIPFNVAIGDIAPFSSLGPTLDGRVKPDITAPGNVIISAVQITDEGYNAGGSKFDELAINADNSTTGRYASQQGTSMATPMVTGIVALLLQARPKLMPDDIKAIFVKTGRWDAFTGDMTAQGSNRWGRGKIDAQASLKEALSTAVAAALAAPGFSADQKLRDSREQLRSFAAGR